MGVQRDHLPLRIPHRRDLDALASESVLLARVGCSIGREEFVKYVSCGAIYDR